MLKLDDIVALAKAGWTPKQTKEILEMIETSPEVKKVEMKEDDKGEPVIEKKEEPDVKEEAKVKEEPQDDIATLINLLKEE